MRRVESFLQEEVAKVLPSFEERSSQLKMLRACAKAIEEGGILLVEAPTGVGKTLAYLIPILLSDQKAIVSTRTINLQEQLFHKDLPLLSQLLKFDFALAKGYSNYLCKLFWHEETQQDPSELEWGHLNAWVAITQTGDREELDFVPKIWDEICADSDSCLRRECDFYPECFYFTARSRWEQAKVLVANHALIAADAVMFGVLGEGLLPKADILVLDEAHRLDEVFSEAFTSQLTQLGLLRLIEKLIGVHDGRRGILHHDPLYDADLILEVEGLRLLGEGFFRKLRETYPDPCKLRVLPGSFPLNRDLELLGDAIRRMGSALEELRSAHPIYRSSPPQIKRLIAKLNQAIKTLDGFGLGATLFLEGDSESVRWVEISKRRAALVTAPLYPAQMVRECLLPRYRTIILTSATLGVEGDFSFVQEKLGFEGEALALQSSFNYQKQAILCVADLTPPGEGKLTEEYLEELVRLIEGKVKESQGGALVLFTSWQALKAVEERLRDRLPYKMLVQGSKPRHKLLEDFKADGNAVLLGTGSFWEGVDVPGPALRNLIITKLPFEVPEDPIHQARMEDLERKGRNPFWEYVLPLAVLKFRQGFGRLVRTSSDYGVVWVLDSRLLKRPYGKRFLRSLPQGLPVFASAPHQVAQRGQAGQE